MYFPVNTRDEGNPILARMPKTFFQATATLSRKKLSEIGVQAAAPYNIIVMSVYWHRVPNTYIHTHTHAHKCMCMRVRCKKCVYVS